MYTSSEANFMRMLEVVAFVSRWLSQMINFRRRLPLDFPETLYWSIQIVTLSLPVLLMLFIRHLYNIKLSYAGRQFFLM